METIACTEQLLKNIEYYQRELNYTKNKILDCEANIAVLSNRKSIISSAKEFHRKAIDILYQTSIHSF